MPNDNRCGVCRHPQRAEVERALVRGDSYRTVAKAFGVGKDAVHNHYAEHADDRVRRARERREEITTATATEPAPVPAGGPWWHAVTVSGFFDLVAEILNATRSRRAALELADRLRDEVPEPLHGDAFADVIETAVPATYREDEERKRRHNVSQREAIVMGRVGDPPRWRLCAFHEDTKVLRPIDDEAEEVLAP